MCGVESRAAGPALMALAPRLKPFSGLSATRLGQPVVVNRYAHRDGSVQIDAQDLRHRAELLFHFRLKPDRVPEAASLLIQIGLLASLRSTRLLRSTRAAFFGDRSLRRRDLDVHLTSSGC